MLTIGREVIGNVVVLRLVGRLDAITATEMRPIIEELVAQQQRRVICDLGELVGIDSSGVGAVVSLFKQTRQIGGDVKLISLDGQPKTVFHLLRLERAFDICESIDEALTRFSS